jgi:hypothetical protein
MIVHLNKYLMESYYFRNFLMVMCGITTLLVSHLLHRNTMKAHLTSRHTPWRLQHTHTPL